MMWTSAIFSRSSRRLSAANDSAMTLQQIGTTVVEALTTVCGIGASGGMWAGIFPDRFVRHPDRRKKNPIFVLMVFLKKENRENNENLVLKACNVLLAKLTTISRIGRKRTSREKS